jgi:ArsR family transcriptional regulator
MDAKLYAQMESKAEIFKALAHPSRVFVVSELAKGERCVCELTEMIGADKSTVSKHLSILKKAGIINDRKEGTMVFYSLQTPCVLNFMGCIENMIADKMKAMMELYGGK